jgi:serine/threonine-protein kinase HipA
VGRKRQSKALVVAMNGDVAGTLTRASHGELQFQYATEWLATASAPPISLSLPLSPDPYSGDLVWNFFDNLLPDNADVRGRMQRSLGAESTRPFDLLAAAGRDCVGALQLCERDDLSDVRRIDAMPVSDVWIAERLRTYSSHPLGMAADEDFRISIAGAQEKTALLRLDGAWHVPNGATPTSHIFKLPIGPAPSGIDLSDSVENEWLCLKVASAFGLPVPDAEIARFGDVRVLVVERFDRRWASDRSWLIRLPQEDACQSLGLPSRLKYESEGGPGIAAILQLLLQSSDPAHDRRTFFRALVVYWLLAAIDGHAKNFSVFLHAGGRCRMTPLYDILSAHPIVSRRHLAKQRLKMAMAVEGKNRHYRWQEIRGSHWISTARKSRFAESEALSVLEECAAKVPEVIAQVSAALPRGFPDNVATPIFDGLVDAAAKI